MVDEDILDMEIFREISVLSNPLDISEELLSDAEPLLGTDNKKERTARRNAWMARIARYLAYCVDGGIADERFTMATLVQAMGRGAVESARTLRSTVEFLLHAMPRGD